MAMVKRRAVLILYCLKIGGIYTMVTVWTRFGHRRKNQQKLVTAVGVKKRKMARPARIELAAFGFGGRSCIPVLIGVNC